MFIAANIHTRPVLGTLRRLAVLIAFIVAAMSLAPPGFSQSSPPVVTAPENISITSIERARDRLKDLSDLSETQITNATSAYDTAETAFKDALTQIEDAKRFNQIIVTGPKRLEELQAQIKEMQSLTAADMEGQTDSLTAERLSTIEQSLIGKEAEQRALRSQVTDLRTELETLQSRRAQAPKEQTDAVESINDLSELITARSDSDQDPVAIAQTVALKSRLYFRRAQAVAIENEIASFAENQRVLLARNDLAQLELTRISEEVTALQRLTGQQRTVDALRVVIKTESAFDTLKTTETPRPHPLVLSYAKENVDLSHQLEDIAQEASKLPQRHAQKRSQIDILETDLSTAESLIALGNLSRQSATTLRQLRNDNETVKEVQDEISALNQDIAVATQNQLLAQNRMRQMGPGDADVSIYVKKWFAENSATDQVTAADLANLAILHEDRREILRDITNAARERLESLSQFKATLDTLLSSSTKLTNVLDTNLLWLPSIKAIDLSWPEKVIKGVGTIFSPRNFTLVSRSLVASAKANLAIVIIFIMAAVGCFASRKRLWEDIERRGAIVGRVQKDNYLQTPAVIIAGLIIALPLPIMFFLASILFTLSPVRDLFVSDLAKITYYLALFTTSFLTWRVWDSDKSLFDKHFKLSAELRNTINRELRWFIPFTATSTALIGLTIDSKDPNVFEGFSLAAFILTSFALSYVSYKILWKRLHANDSTLQPLESSRKYSGLFAVSMMGVPLLCAIFSSFGYYETAYELLYRLFISGGLLVATYIVYGLTRRTVVISKRRIALRQAIERRDKAIKAREAQKEAEDRGEDIAPPPAVNYEEIDIESVSRQTEQLLNAFMLVLFAVLMWAIWSDLLPALSFFNNVELGHYMVDSIDPETNTPLTVERAITLWNVIQSIVILCLTVLAGRNLPGFLEIFALSRLGFDAGTRYAIVTILGYIIFGVGLFVALDKLGLQWSQLKWVVTGLSVGIGLGLQKIIANFVSGLIILFERPVRLGDYVTIGEQSGNVTRIQIRATTLVDLDNREIIIPNEALISERVTNWTLSNSITRLITHVGVAYGTDTDQIKAIMIEVAKANPLVLDTPSPQVIFSGFGDSSLDFQLRAYLKSFEDREPTRHALHSEINKAFANANITIPFPQRDLHVITPEAAPIKNKPIKSKPSKA